MSADARLDSRSASCGALTRTRYSTFRKSPPRSSASTTSSWPSARGRASTRTSRSTSSASWPRTSSSTAVSSVSAVSTSTSPAGTLILSTTGPGVANDSVLMFPPSVLGVAGQPLAGAARRRRGAAGQRPHEPGVQRDALAGGGGLELALEAVGQAQGDARGQPVLGRDGRGLGLLPAHVDELGIRARQPHLDVALRELRADLKRGL